MNLPEEDLFQNLEEIWIKLGRQPRYAEVQKPLSKIHVGTYENRFGTWRKALEAFVAYINNEEITPGLTPLGGHIKTRVPQGF